MLGSVLGTTRRDDVELAPAERFGVSRAGTLMSKEWMEGRGSGS